MIINCILLIIFSVDAISSGVIKEPSKSVFTGSELKQICKSIQSNVNSGVGPVKSQANVFNEYSSKLGLATDSSEKLNKLESNQHALKFKRLLKAFTQLIGTVDRLNNGLQVKQEDETSNDGESNFQNGNSDVDDQVKPSDGDNDNGNEVDIDGDDHDDDDDDDNDDEGDENYSDEFDVCEFIDYPDEVDLNEVEYGDLDSVDYEIYEYEFEPFGLSLNLHLAVSH